VSFLPAKPAFVWNFSASAPTGLYRVLSRPARKGDWVALDPPPNVRALLSEIRQEPQHRLLVKRMAAVGGDVVCRRGKDVFINGSAVAEIVSDRIRHVLMPSWRGCRSLAANEAFFLGNTRRSFDSRYFGPVETTSVVGPVLRVEIH